MIDQADLLRVEVHVSPDGTRVVDCGVHASGGLEAGRRLAEVCISGLGRIDLVPGSPWPLVVVRTDQPLLACMASQYAGWRISIGDYFAMASGPMRAMAAKERLFDRIGCREADGVAVGVLESATLPSVDVCRAIARECGVEPADLILLAARTASQAGTVQVVARSVETAMHKLFELDFDLGRVESALGTAPLAPVARDDLTAMGRSNDAILYGAAVTLWVRGDDETLSSAGQNLPSIASPDHGRPFVQIFNHYERDFYKIDPRLFAPAMVTLANLDTGRSFRFGRLVPELIEESFTG